MRFLFEMLLPITILTCLSAPPSLAADPPARTGKERLSDKASDEQRVNDCKVSLGQRGASTRSPNCTADFGS